MFSQPPASQPYNPPPHSLFSFCTESIQSFFFVFPPLIYLFTTKGFVKAFPCVFQTGSGTIHAPIKVALLALTGQMTSLNEQQISECEGWNCSCQTGDIFMCLCVSESACVCQMVSLAVRIWFSRVLLHCL